VLGDTLPVYVWDRYEEFSRVVPMVDLPDDEIEAYLEANVRALTRVVRENGVTAIHANHTVLMSVVAQRVAAAEGIPFSVMPHGSALEYAVKRDERFLRMGTEGVRRRGADLRARRRDARAGARGVRRGAGDRGEDGRPAPRRRHLAVRAGPARRAPPQGREAGRFAGGAPARAHAGADRRDARRPARRPGGRGARPRLDVGRGFDTKAPDAELEERLRAIEWERDPILLYVGRLISAKGVQEVVAALPLLLERTPGLRLVLVGHGPLREPLEAMLWALEHGERALFGEIVRNGRALEGDPEGEGGGHALTKVARFLDGLEARGELDDYFEAGRRHVRRERVVFTGYLTHRELR
jgi:glycosyltransferase involved in cell wall biosynthesis